MQMNLSRKPLVAFAAALTAAVPLGSASAQAATLPGFDPAAFHFPATGWGTGLNGAAWGALPATPLSFVAPSIGQLAVVIGPTINTTSIGPGSGVSFVNTNNQVSAGSPVAGGQVTG
jgi:hypothetical protein